MRNNELKITRLIYFNDIFKLEDFGIDEKQWMKDEKLIDEKSHENILILFPLELVQNLCVLDSIGQMDL